MDWSIDKSRAICPQICEQLCMRIAKGELKPGTRLISVRELAVQAGVNPNTVQRSFEVMEGQGIVHSVRGSGWFVAEDILKAQETLSRIINEKTAEYFEIMKTLGMSTENIKKYVEEWTE